MSCLSAPHFARYNVFSGNRPHAPREGDTINEERSARFFVVICPFGLPETGLADRDSFVRATVKLSGGQFAADLIMPDKAFDALAENGVSVVHVGRKALANVGHAKIVIPGETADIHQRCMRR